MLCFAPIASSNISPDEAANAFRLILRAIVVIVFLGMNVVYQLFWKKSAKADYFESRGITELPPDGLDLLIPQAIDFAPKPSNGYICHCGFDLQSDPHHCLDVVGDEPIRCPKCEREFIRDEPAVMAATQLKTEPTPIAPVRMPETGGSKDFQQVDQVEDKLPFQADAVEIVEDLRPPIANQPEAAISDPEVVGAIP